MSYGDKSPEVQKLLQEMQRREFKTLVKEAIKEWLDDQAAVVGRWSIRFFMLSVLGALTYFILTSQGWHK